ncbi:MAG: glycoside hydrolase family 3 [Deltaproteobacteria bacterium]|nr:glycoside hydrolase family 3 [Deltaproteobacteria bacterium]
MNAAHIAALALSAFFAAFTSPATAHTEPEIMLGQMLMLGFHGDGEMTQGDIPQIKELIRQGKIGGVILFDRDQTRSGAPRNIISARQVKALTSSLAQDAPLPLFVAVDQEGGRVQRLKPAAGFKARPSARELGRVSAQETRKLAADLGRELAGVGINLNFAPSLDLDFPHSPAIGSLDRAFSPDPHLTARQALAFMRGLNDAGVIACFKHFPGHGSATSDTHMGTTDITASWQTHELEPYRKLLGLPGRYAVMAAHVFHRELDPQYPASLSPRIIQNLLRAQLGWQGVVFSDDLQMGAIQKNYPLREALLLGLRAGVDVFILGNNQGEYQPNLGEEAHRALLDIYRQGLLHPERLQESFKRIMKLKTEE